MPVQQSTSPIQHFPDPQTSLPTTVRFAALGDDLEQLWDHPSSPAALKKRILRTVLQEVSADTTDDPPTVHVKLHWVGGSHTELTVPKNRTGYHNHINSQEVTDAERYTHEQYPRIYELISKSSGQVSGRVQYPTQGESRP